MTSETQLRVLVVSDDEEHRDAIARALGDRFSISTASTGARARERLEAQPADCVLLDYRLPDCTGLELLPQLGDPAPAVVMLTSQGSQRIAVEAMKLGCYDYLVRTGVSAERVEATVTSAVGRRRRELEIERERRELRAFVSLAAHDLKAPLRHIHAFSSLAERALNAEDPVRAKSCLATVRGAAERLSGLVEALLGYTRMDSVELRSGVVDLEAVVDQLIRELVTGSESSDARVERAELPRVWGDAHLLAQLLQNLIGNGLKFRGEAAPVVHIQARREEDRWQIRVSDNGIGIDPNFHQQVFEPLRRLHPASSYEGYGLGLYASKRIVERHGGRIWIESKPGEGTTVCLTLSAEPLEQGPQSS